MENGNRNDSLFRVLNLLRNYYYYILEATEDNYIHFKYDTKKRVNDLSLTPKCNY